MKLYHGSNMAIETIDLSKGRIGKDFGRGFYLSADPQQALRMAELTTFRLSFGTPHVTTYEFDEQLLHSDLLKVKQFDCYDEEWAEFIVNNRNNRSEVQVHDFDVVIGPIANDKVGVQMRLFTDKYIDIKELVKRLSFIHPTFQYFFATEKAIKHLHRI